MRKVLGAIALAIPVAVFTQAPADSVSPRAKHLHDHAIVVDSLDDTTQWLISDEAFDIGTRNPNGNIDIPRLREGGLDALFFSIVRNRVDARDGPRPVVIGQADRRGVDDGSGQRIGHRNQYSIRVER